MAASQKSRWAWMSQAVASVESGLDKILADEEDEAKGKAIPKPADKSQENGTASARASTDLKRSDSGRATEPKNDRLQARLAQAMAKKSPTPSRPITPQPDQKIEEQPQPFEESVEAKQGEPIQLEMEEKAQESAAEPTVVPSIDVSTADVPVHEEVGEQEKAYDEERDLTQMQAGPNRFSADSLKISSELPSRTSLSDTLTDADEQVLKTQLQHEKTLAEVQKEVNGYLERIDALQRNLQILTRETIQNAKSTKSEADASSSDKQLADKDEKIAMLIEEGTKLTKNELQYRNTIKKLRAEAATLNKDQTAVSQRAERAEKSVAAAQARAIKAEAETKRLTFQVSTLNKSSTDMQAITKERNALQSTLAEVRAQLGKSNQRAEEAERKAQTDKLEAERRRVTELQDDLSSVKVERELAEDKLKREMEDLKQAILREKQQSRQMETEMLAEQAALESKLEAYRVRAEEVSSGDQSDTQAKLLRQIETLQMQSSAASSNWQGIESSLLARITAVEKERDEFVSREADLRRKLREATSKAKNASKELEEVRESLHSVQDEQDRGSEELRTAKKQVLALTQDLADLRKELGEQKNKFDLELTRQLDEERAKWTAYTAMSTPPIESAPPSRRPHGTSILDTLPTSFDRPISRRSSAHPMHDYSIPSPRIHSSASFRPNGHLETPSLMSPDENDEFFANVPVTPASVTHADSARLHEVISASTAAGPSVQLVERLSTTVRRLESEKAASKDELSRLSSQRDEARQEVVNLMRELDTKRETSDRLESLEKEHAALSTKYDETLELLGEKSEQVEELKADIVDVKQMYRHLADTMGK